MRSPLLHVTLLAPLTVSNLTGDEPDNGRQREQLDRGVIAVEQGGGTVYVGWRLWASDPPSVAFNVYRDSDDAPRVRLNAEPLRHTTDLVDTNVTLTVTNRYRVCPILQGVEGPASKPSALSPANTLGPFLSIPLRTPAGYAPNDASVGDLDGDGQYEIVLHQAGRGRDNSQAGMTDPPILQAYRLDGTFLWQINLGRNIREGAHYTQFIVYDLDGDGCAEIACKTADGTVDGLGKVIGAADANHVEQEGRTLGKILRGPEFLTVFDGRTGAARVTVDYVPPRGRHRDWGDDYGNRVDRFLACIAYLDGRRPSLVMCRGYYTRAVLAAWNWRDGQLNHLWTFDSDAGPEANRAYRGQGNHNLAVADVDGDGRDEIIYGACAINDDGTGLYTTGLGHGDALHVSDFDPDRPGLEAFGIHEKPTHANGANLRDAATGRVLWGKAAPDVGRGVAFDVDPNHRGAEMWAAGFNELWNARGEVISRQRPRSCNMGIWWDADPLRELLDGVNVTKWDWIVGQESPVFSAKDFGCAANNGSKANPSLCADIIGDWREELICRTADNQELRIFVSTIPARAIQQRL